MSCGRWGCENGGLVLGLALEYAQDTQGQVCRSLVDLLYNPRTETNRHLKKKGPRKAGSGGSGRTLTSGMAQGNPISGN